MDCPICYETMTHATSGVTSCGHRFCKDCLFRIRTTATAAQTCPLCRAPLTARAQTQTQTQPQTQPHLAPKPPPLREWVSHLRLEDVPTGGVYSLRALHQTAMRRSHG